MKIKMTIDECLDFADEWGRGVTLQEDSVGWRVVCMLLADEVRMLRLAKEAAVLNERLACAIVSPNEVNVNGNDCPHQVWQKYSAAIRLRGL